MEGIPVENESARFGADGIEVLPEGYGDVWRSVLEWPELPAPAAASVLGDKVVKPSSPPRDESRRSKSLSPSRAATGHATEDVELSKQVVEVTRRRRFLSLEELMDSLPQAPERETVLGICGEIPSIKVFAHPNMTLLQWQSG